VDKQLSPGSKDNVMPTVSTPHDSDADSRFSNWSGINDETPIDHDKASSSDSDVSSSLSLDTRARIRPSGKYLNRKYSSWPFGIIGQSIDSFTTGPSTTATAPKESITEKETALMSGALQAEDAPTNAISEDFSQDASRKDWPSTGEVRPYSGPLFPPRKTGLLSPVAPHTGGRVSIPIPRGLQYIEFPQRLSAQDPTQIRTALEDCDALRSCLKKRLDELENQPNIEWRS